MTLLTEPPPAAPIVDETNWIDAPDGRLYELIDGTPVEKHVSMLSMWIATRIAILIGNFVDPPRSLGFVVVEQPVLGIWGRPRHGRRPDVLYISRTKLPTLPETGDLEVTPDLVVEVVSTHDNVADFEEKLQEYLVAGVRQIWAVYPRTKSVRVYMADGSSRLLNITGTLDAADAIPGFTCPVADIFPKI
jgi:Uma2 family endonuclease